ncbi:Zeta toxin family protein [Parafrankia sp. EAN1pec]|uniref:zeta toxin family protein n=1 Tax=Parafrankia sp. (strain EAN1pec) TaxID=298653 RepID=UPI00015DA08C|nr:Zeta toxin family protein [Frankia sp. EAN1pec]
MTQPNPYYLPEERAREIFTNEIVREKFAGVVSHRDDGRRPVAVIVMGQPGAGKTRIADAVKQQLDERGGAAHVVGDFYKPYHPDYDELVITDPERASPLTSPDARRWIDMATEYVIDQRADVLLESAGRDRADFADIAERLHNNGYRVEAAVVAVDEAHSRLGIVDRYHEQVADTGYGRLTARETHDLSYAGVLDSADFIDRSDAVDAVAVVRRNNEILYANERDASGGWQQAPATREAIEAERGRSWSPEETEQFANKIDNLANAMGPQWHTEFDDITDRARARADPAVALPKRSPTVETSTKAGSRSPIPASGTDTAATPDAASPADPQITPAAPSHTTQSPAQASFSGSVKPSPPRRGSGPPPGTPPPGPQIGQGPAKGR